VLYIIVHSSCLCKVIYCSQGLISEGVFVPRRSRKRNSAIFSGVMPQRETTEQYLVRSSAKYGCIAEIKGLQIGSSGIILVVPVFYERVDK
jgi:hypothetical protein